MLPDPNNYYAGGLSVESYDLFTGGGLLEGDVAFYLNCAKQFGGPILELATGTGRILHPLASAGYEVVGLDNSQAMLDLARAKLQRDAEAGKRAQLHHGSMTGFNLGRTFPNVMIPARSFQHLASPDDQRAALQCVRRHLNTGGYLILDLVDPYFDWLFGDAWKSSKPREVKLPNSNRTVRRTLVSRETDPLLQTVTEKTRFEELDAFGKIIATEEASWVLRWNMRQETAYLLELCGFEVVDQFSDFSRSPPAYAREQLWVARAV